MAIGRPVEGGVTGCRCWLGESAEASPSVGAESRPTGDDVHEDAGFETLGAAADDEKGSKAASDGFFPW